MVNQSLSNIFLTSRLLDILLKQTPNKMNSGLVVWFTGPPAAGKTTLALGLHNRLKRKGLYSFVLDGDVMRRFFYSDLGYSYEDRQKNIFRAGNIAALLAKNRLVLAAFISPYADSRKKVRALMPNGHFLEVYLNTPIKVCEFRDPKGNYAKARFGIIKNFTGIDDPYEPPQNPDLVLPTHKLDLISCLDLLEQIIIRNLIKVN